jgi:hypothetical protein
MTCIPAQIPSNFRTFIPDNNDDLSNEITRLAGHINAANYRFLKLLAALVERGVWAGYGIKTPAHWLNYYCGITLGPAREKVRVALCLDKLPLIDAAFRTGEISYSKVRAMTRAATPDNEEFLLRIAKHGTASHVEKLVRGYERVEKLSRDDHSKAQTDSRKFSWHTDDDGMLVFKGRLAPEEGAVFVEAMDAVMHQMNEEAFQRERAEKICEHSSEAIDVSAETPNTENNKAPEEPYTFPQKRADALVRVAEHYLATAKDGPVPLSGGDKTHVIVHINADSNTDAHHPAAWIENGPVLSPATVKRLASDASLVTVLEDKDGKVLNVGRKTRTIPPSIRRALILRDQGCRFPGCCESKYVDAHHIHHWCDGGETSLDNLVLLCRRHHRLVHEEGYGIENDQAGNPVFTTPGAQPLPRAVYPQFTEYSDNRVSAGTLLAIEQQHKEMGLEIEEKTAITAWLGEPMDYGWAVEALYRRNHRTH